MQMPATAPVKTQPPLYDNVRAFNRSDGDMRIFSPVSYARVRNAQIVPAVHTEALSLAHWYPVCWQRDGEAATLVALRTLRNDGSCQPAGSNSLVAMPLALRAYPFVVGAEQPEGNDLIETDISDEPSDIGAPMMTVGGTASAGSLLKLRAKAAFDEALPLTQAMTDALVTGDLLEPWPLDFDIGGEKIGVVSLSVIKAHAISSPGMFQFIERFGPAAAVFLGAHRISLFRAGILFQAANSKQPGQSQLS